MTKFSQVPYISVNGAVNYSDIPKIDGSKLHTVGSRLTLGTQVSHKTQVQCIENKYSKDWFPVGKLLGAIANSKTILHNNYHIADPDYVETFATLAHTNCQRVANVSSGYDDRYGITNPVRGMQHNQLPWHNTEYHAQFDRLNDKLWLDTVVLQATHDHFKDLSPKEFAAKLRTYGSVVSHVLLDESSSTGKVMDTDKLRTYIESIYDLEDIPQITIAGGLKPENLEDTAGNLLFKYPTISIDADSGLRTNFTKEQPNISRFSVQKANDFISEYILLKQKYNIINDYLSMQNTNDILN